jgi:ubiquinone/menaquinone biosynthesis C-methylase UbiE
VRRVLRSHAEARASYNAMSRWYDALANRSEAPLRELGLDLLDVRTGEWVLEIGCGTGHGLVRLARDVGAEGGVVGVDISDGMARLATERVRGAESDARVSVCVGDGERLCLAQRSFDAVFMSFTLELFDTPLIPRVLDQCRAVLRSGGRIGVVALSSQEAGRGLPVRLYEWLHDLAPRWIDCRPIPVIDILVRSGFRIREVRQAVMWGLPVGVVTASAEGP